jgi:hypothetical protein
VLALAAPAVPEPAGWREALQFYADRDHFMLSDESAWDTVSGEPANLWCDEAGTATVEDGSVAAAALKGTPAAQSADADPLQAAANWIVEWLRGALVGDIQSRLLIGYNRAKRLYDAAISQSVAAAKEASMGDELVELAEKYGQPSTNQWGERVYVFTLPMLSDFKEAKE